ncbi:hypothetical protein PA598K_00441 [Paenibacillus sp. 598K]|nr:hypothetical protein PA598K_00441 [Paenibacillus sp. 598K]
MCDKTRKTEVNEPNKVTYVPEDGQNHDMRPNSVPYVPLAWGHYGSTIHSLTIILKSYIFNLR